jgi:hypothetical protein
MQWQTQATRNARTHHVLAPQNRKNIAVLNVRQCKTRQILIADVDIRPAGVKPTSIKQNSSSGVL